MGELRDFAVVFHRDICREHSLTGRRNCLLSEAVNSVSAAAGPELSINLESYRQSSFGLGCGRTRLGSGLRAAAPRCLDMENADTTMTVLHHAMCGDNFDQSLCVNNNWGKMIIKVFFLVLWAMEHT